MAKVEENVLVVALYAEGGVELSPILAAQVPQLDMWRLTADQGENCAKIHCDELYVPEGEGFVSRTAANLLLNMACNDRLLPEMELMKHV